MSTLAVIPARLGSTRLPQKPLQLLAGTPLILRVWEHVSAMGIAERVVIATDASAVADVAREAGAEVVMTRDDHPSGTDRVAEVAALREYNQFDIIVNVQGDEPAIPHAAVAQAVALVRDGGFEIGTAAVPDSADVLREPNVVKVVVDDTCRALYFSRAAIPFLRDPVDARVHAALVRRHLGVYAYRRTALERLVSLPPHPLELAERLEQLRALAAGMSIGVATVAAPAYGGIDTVQDLAAANAHWTSHAHP